MSFSVFSVGQQIVESNKLFAEHKLPMVAVHSNLDDYVSLVHSEVQRYARTNFHPHAKHQPFALTWGLGVMFSVPVGGASSWTDGPARCEWPWTTWPTRSPPRSLRKWYVPCALIDDEAAAAAARPLGKPSVSSLYSCCWSYLPPSDELARFDAL